MHARYAYRCVYMAANAAALMRASAWREHGGPLTPAVAPAVVRVRAFQKEAHERISQRRRPECES